MKTFKILFASIGIALLSSHSSRAQNQDVSKTINTPSNHNKAGFYVEVNSGVSIAHFLPLSGTEIPEHLVENGRMTSAGVGYGWNLSKMRLDAGIKINYLNLKVKGSYSRKSSNDSLNANYSYLFPVISLTAVSKFNSRTNFLLGLSLGTATFISDKQGQKISSSQIPIFGTIDAGLEITLTEWLKLRPVLSWIPPFKNLNVLTPQIGIRAKL